MWHEPTGRDTWRGQLFLVFARWNARRLARARDRRVRDQLRDQYGIGQGAGGSVVSATRPKPVVKTGIDAGGAGDPSVRRVPTAE